VRNAWLQMATTLIASKGQDYQVGLFLFFLMFFPSCSLIVYNEDKMKETSILPIQVLELSI
jgi:4-hydroxybenzoate polyprenyltransferase